MNELIITTLIENTPDDNAELAYEHGLSLFVEFDGKKILFDTGQSGAFLENAAKLNKNLGEVDYIFISHGHYDHSGGVPGLLKYLVEKKQTVSAREKEIATIPMYVGNEFFQSKYKRLPNNIWHYNGNPFNEGDVLNAPVELHKLTEDITYITENIIAFKNFKKYTTYEKTNPKFYVGEDSLRIGETQDMPGSGSGNSELIRDEFADEIVLGLLTGKGLVLIVGCSHVGIVNILENVIERTGLSIYSVLGGTHLVEADAERLQRTVEALRGFGLQEIAVSHCTGEQGMELVRAEFGEGFIRNNTGNIYRLQNIYSCK